MGYGFSLEGRESLPVRENPNSLQLHPIIMDVFTTKYKPKQQFEHLEYIGYSSVLQGAIPASPPDEQDLMFGEILGEYPEFSKLHDLAQHRSAKCSPETYNISLKKCDVPRILPKNNKMDLAYLYTKKMLSFLVGAKQMAKVEYEPTAAVGAPQNRILNPETGRNFINKGDYLNSQYGQEEMKKFYRDIFIAASKIEFLPLEEIKVKKSRTYFIGNTPLVIRQKMMYDRMDQLMCDKVENWFKCWSRYGFTRQYGGFNRLARAHQKIEEIATSRGLRKWVRHVTADVSGWDRATPLMEMCYQLRKELYGEMTEEEQKLHDYIVECVVTPMFSTFQGEIYKRKTGNVSGSGKTTSDNTIMHIMMEFYLWISLFEQKNNRLPDYEDIVNHIVNSLYGDDNIGSFIICDWVPDEVVDKDEYFTSQYIAIYQEFGLTIKRTAYNIQDNLQGLEFLGGFLHYDTETDMWLAKPRISKVATTLCYQLEGARTVEQYSSIIQAISALVWHIPGDDCDIIRRYLQVLSQRIILEDEDELSSNDSFFLTSVVLGNLNLKTLMLGLEGKLFFGQNDSNFFFNLQSKRDRVGFISEMRKTQNSKSSYIKDMNYKGRLFELCAKRHLALPTLSWSMSGPAHSPVFTVNGQWLTYRSTAAALSKKEAENLLSYNFLSMANVSALELEPQVTKDFGLYNRRPVDYESNFDPADCPDGSDSEDSSPDVVLTAQQAMARLDLASKTKTSLVVPPIKPTPIVPNFNQGHFEKNEPGNQVPKRRVDDENQFWLDLVKAIKSYSDCSVDERPFHPLSLLTDKPDLVAAARLAQCFKEGSFNPYGNGQTSSQFTIGKPTYKTANSVVTCFSTCFTPDVVGILGSGTTQEEAFADWLTQVTEQFNVWSPEINPQIIRFFNLLRESTPRDVNCEFGYIWQLPEDQAREAFFTKFKEGSFNPYGNGQPPMSKKAWLAANASRVGNLEKTEVDKMYTSYVNKKKKKQPVPPQKKTMNKPVAKVPMKEQKTGYEKRAEFKLSGCAEDYANALTYPFAFCDASGYKHVKINPDMLPCIPKFPAIKTRKSMYQVRGQLGIGAANGVGFVSLAPWRLANNGNTATDVDCAVLYSIPTLPYSGNAFPPFDLGGAWTSGAANFNTPYTKAQLANVNGVGIKYRVVGAGLRIKYIGSNFSMGGMINGFTDPNHGSVSGLTITAISQFDTYFSTSVIASTKRNDGWQQVTYTPVAEDDFDFHIDPLSYTIGGDPAWQVDPFHNHFMGFVITGLPVGETMEWHAVLLTEEVGQNVPGKTDTPSDPLGVAVATNSIKAETQKKLNDSVPLKTLISQGASEMTATGMDLVKAPVVSDLMSVATKVLTGM